MPRFPSAQGRLNHEPDSTLAVTKTCPKDGVHLSELFCQVEQANLVFDDLWVCTHQGFPFWSVSLRLLFGQQPG